MHSATLATSLLALTIPLTNACTYVSDVEVTFYGYPDNSPPGASTAYDCGGRNYIAGGIGTYDSPLTFASDSKEFNVCEIIYLPYLKKYLRLEDDCVQCDSDWKSGKHHIDIWTGSSTSNGGSTQIDCEDSLTPDGKQVVVRSPESGLPVDATVLYKSGTCNTGHLYKNPTLPKC